MILKISRTKVRAVVGCTNVTLMSPPAASSSDVQVLPLITPPLAAFTPPAASLESSFFSQAPLLSTLVANDIDVLEEVCTMIESLVLDTEDVRLALARGFSSPAEHSGMPGLSMILEFLELGDYPPIWNNPVVFDDAERKRRQTIFGRCKAALVKAIVEVAGEPKNTDILWNACEEPSPGGPFVYKMVQWIKAYVEEAGDSGGIAVQGLRDDMVIAAALSLGNLAHRCE